MNNFNQLEENLGVKFADKNLLEKALTHRSFLNETQEKNLTSNERLEFLGDAVLSLTVSTYLYEKYPQLPEGDLTNLRASLVRTQTLAKVAENLNLGNYLFLSKGEEEGNGRRNLSLLADSFEALIAAIFLDQGLSEAEKFVQRNLLPILSEIIENKSYKDSKSLFQERVQAERKTSPTYKVLSSDGPDHHKIFTVGAFAGDLKLGEGMGHSKQEAEEKAAKDALEKMDLIE